MTPPPPFRLLGDRLLVLLPPATEAQDAATGYTYQARATTASGLVLAAAPDTYDVRVHSRGIVVARGPGRDLIPRSTAQAAVLAVQAEDGQHHEPVNPFQAILRRLDKLAPAPREVAVQDCVLFLPSAGERFTYEDREYVILDEDQIAAILLPEKDPIHV